MAAKISIKFIKDKLNIGRQYAKKGAKNGFFHILGGNTLVQCIGALVPLLFPRIMGSNYGTFSAAQTFMTYLVIFSGFGMANGILRYCAVYDKPEDKKGYFSYAIKFGLWANSVIIVVFGGILWLLMRFKLYSLPFGSYDLFLLMSFTTLLNFVYNALQYYLRANKENRLFSKTSVVGSGALAGFQVLFALIFKIFKMEMQGAAIGLYVAYAVAAGYAFWKMRKLPTFTVKPAKLRRSEKAGILKYSANSMIASSFSLLMPTNESALVSNMVEKSQFGDFSAAQKIPNSITFIANAVMIYTFPYFARNYRDGKWVWKNTVRLVTGMTVFMAVVTLLGIIFAPQLVLIYGKNFQTKYSISLTRIFFLAYGISGAVRVPVGNVLAAVGEIRFNIINSFFTFAIHLALCWYLTSHYGIGGAAYGLLIGYVFASVVAMLYLRYYCAKIEKKKDNKTIPEDDEDIEADEKELL